MGAKKILLIHPLGYSAKKAGNDISRTANIMPPLGLASISAYLSKHDVKNDIIDCYAHPDSNRKIEEYITKENPTHVGFSCTTSSFFDGVQITRKIKKILPHGVIVFGGVHVSSLNKKILHDFLDIDLVVVGEGEETLLELILNDPATYDKIPGLCYRTPLGSVIFTGVRKKLIDLDTLPFPAYDKLAQYPQGYTLPIFNYPKAPNASCISSRGCPYSCSYCDRSVFRKSFRYNSADYLYRHMKYLKESFGICHINFYDDQFTFNRQRIMDLSKMIRANTLDMTFNCAARAEHLDGELLSAMKAAGCWMISLGIETGDPELLAMHRQNPDLNMIKDKIYLIKKAGIRVKGLLMMGLPGESEASIQRSKAYVRSLPIDDFNLAKFTPFPGSPVYKQIKEKGEQIGAFNEEWEHMDCMQFLFVPRGMTLDRMEELFINFYKSHFTRPKVMWGYFSMIWKSPDSWLRFIKNISMFLKFTRTNKRIS